MKIGVRRKIREHLATGPKDTDEILDYLNNRTHYGSTKQSLVNILSKDPHIIKSGDRMKRGTYGKTSLWRLK